MTLSGTTSGKPTLKESEETHVSSALPGRGSESSALEEDYSQRRF